LYGYGCKVDDVLMMASLLNIPLMIMFWRDVRPKE
jgi:hypothetical protein